MTIDIAPQDMVTFAAVVRTGGFTRAAQALGTTKQAVSSRVARLEAQLGVRLLERTTRQMRPTDAGATYFERCQQIAQQIEDANRDVLDQRSTPTGTLRASVPHLFARRVLPALMVDYLTQHPGVRVELVLADRRVNLVEEGFDVAIRAGVLDDSALHARRLGSLRVAAMASPAVAARLRRTSPRELRDDACIGIRPIETWAFGRDVVRLRPRFVVNDLEIACAAACAGLGVAMLPSLVARDALARGQLREVWPAHGFEVPVHALFPSRAALAPKVRAFIDVLTRSPVIATAFVGAAAGRRRAAR